MTREDEAKLLLKKMGYKVIKESHEDNPLFGVIDFLNITDYEYYDEIEESGVVRVNGTRLGDIEISYNDNPNYSEGVGYYVADDEGEYPGDEKYFETAQDVFEYVCSIMESKKITNKEIIKESIEDTEDEELQEAIKELAEETGNDIEDVEIDEHGNYTNIQFGREEYMVFSDHDEAESVAKEYCEDLLEDTGIEGIRFEYLGGIERFVNEKWFEEAFEDMADSYIGDLSEEEMKEEFDTTDEEEAKEKYLENYSDDYIQSFIDEFGKQVFNEVIEKNNLINISELAEAIVDTDGVANQLASYDGEEIELSNGYYAYRTN